MSDDVRPTRRVGHLPQMNPAILVLDVQQLLAARGIPVLIDMGSANTAICAAADLLRALGVSPAAAPESPAAPGTGPAA